MNAHTVDAWRPETVAVLRRRGAIAESEVSPPVETNCAVGDAELSLVYATTTKYEAVSEGGLIYTVAIAVRGQPPLRLTGGSR